jgi:hypothetical protein
MVRTLWVIWKISTLLLAIYPTTQEAESGIITGEISNVSEDYLLNIRGLTWPDVRNWISSAFRPLLHNVTPISR